MAVYKVLQDIEAEDKLVGPLTLKGFIYAGMTFVLGFINFKLMISIGGPFKWLLILVFLPPMVLFGVLASPLGRQQPTEVWLLARLRFMAKPRRRLWNQSGISNLVTITAPKKIEKPKGKGLSEKEVHSRLETLALTLDSRGWAIKNLTLPSDKEDESDRLVSATVLPDAAEGLDIEAADDIMDEQNNATAQNFQKMMDETDAKRKIGVANRLDKARQAAAKAPAKVAKAAEPQAAPEVVTGTDRADKLELAQSGSAFSVATVAKLANRRGIQIISPNEVLISLH